MVIPTKSQHIYLWSEATFIFGTENVSSQQNVGIDPNTFEVLNGHSNKIPTDKILEGVVQNCRKYPETGKTAEILWTLSVTEIPYSVYCLFCQPSNKKKLRRKEMLNFFLRKIWRNIYFKKTNLKIDFFVKYGKCFETRKRQNPLWCDWCASPNDLLDV